MYFGQLYNLITMDSTPSSSSSPIVDIFRFSSMHKLFANFSLPPLSKTDSKLGSSKSLVARLSSCRIEEDSSHLRKKDEGISREDATMVMEMLGIYCSPESEPLQEWFDSEDLSTLFEEKEPSFGEMKQAFDVFDENGDGFIDAQELRRVLCILGFSGIACIDNCRKMIDNHDSNGDGKLSFKEFVKFVERCPS